MKRFINLSIDVEQDMPPFGNGHRGIREGIPKILDMLNDYDIKATFFITGEICSKFPKVVKEISKKHEIASHSWDHTLFKKLNIYEQYQNIKKSKDILEKTIKRKVIGFRAPEHIITKETLNLLEILDFKYDSSALFHTYYPRKYNYLRYPSEIYHPDYNNPRKKGNMNLIEIPASSFQGVIISMFNLRTFGNNIINYAKKVYNKKNYLTFYIHPWEIVPLERKKGIRTIMYRNLGEESFKRFKHFINVFSGEDFQALEDTI